MNRLVALAVAACILAVGFASPAFAEPAQKGQTCRMEQQCKWVNFKKDLHLGESLPVMS